MSKEVKFAGIVIAIVLVTYFAYQRFSGDSPDQVRLTSSDGLNSMALGGNADRELTPSTTGHQGGTSSSDTKVDDKDTPGGLENGTESIGTLSMATPSEEESKPRLSDLRLDPLPDNDAAKEQDSDVSSEDDSTARKPDPVSPPVTPPSNGSPVEVYLVENGDTLAGISVMYYGDESYIAALLSANPTVQSPDLLSEGMQLVIPAMPRKTVDESIVVGDFRPYRVREGDSFYSISKRELGDANRWHELFELNKAKVKGGDPKKLRPGQEILLPKS